MNSIEGSIRGAGSGEGGFDGEGGPSLDGMAQFLDPKRSGESSLWGAYALLVESSNTARRPSAKILASKPQLPIWFRHWTATAQTAIF